MDKVNKDATSITNIDMCLDCPKAGYSNQGRPYCTKVKRHLDSFSYKPIWCPLKTDNEGGKIYEQSKT